MDVYFDVDRDPDTGQLQLSIGNAIGGFRLAGPEYNGRSKNLLRYRPGPEDIRRIKHYLDSAEDDRRLLLHPDDDGDTRGIILANDPEA